MHTIWNLGNCHYHLDKLNIVLLSVFFYSVVKAIFIADY